MTQVEVVVARYRESLEWVANLEMHLKKLGYSVTVFVYNKGEDMPNVLDEWIVERLPNVGRESHTHLHHISKRYSHYKQITENSYIVFLQGSIDDHLRTWNPQYLNTSTLVSDFINDAIQNGGASMKWATKHELVGSMAAHWNFRIAQHNGRAIAPRADECFGEWITKHVDASAFCDRHDLLNWWIAGLFSVSTRLLTSSHDLEYYENLKELLSKDNDPEIGHYCERSWVYITGANKFLPPAYSYEKNKKGKLL